MEAARQHVRTQTWDRLVRERVGQPLRPERLRSLLVVVPAASGDVALATTVVRHVKRINSDCQVKFATRKINVPLVKMCPGVDATIEMPAASRPRDGHGWEAVSRRQYLQEYADGAEAVVCTCFFPEDKDLLTEHGLNALEAIWLLAGVPDGIPQGPHQVWLEPPTSVEAPSVVRHAFGGQAKKRLLFRGLSRLPESAARIIRSRSLQGSGITLAARDLAGFLKNMVELSRPIHGKRAAGDSLGRDFVILSTEAVSVTPPPRGVTEALVKALRRDGRTVLHNVRDPIRAAAGTVPLVCSYPEFVGLRAAGIPFVGWRSGLCDIAAASRAPMAVLYPPEHDWCQDQLGTFGLNEMRAAECLEFVCRGPGDIRAAEILDYLQQKTAERKGLLNE